MKLNKTSKKRIETDNPIMESSTTFHLLEEYPSHKYMVMAKRKNVYVPSISSINLLQNIADLDIGNITIDATILKQREEYAKIVLLLFYPYWTQDDLMLMGSYCNKYECQEKDSENTISFDKEGDMLQQLDSFGVREVHPTQRSLNIIAFRVNILPLNIPEYQSPLANIADILEGVTISCGLPTTNKTRATANDVIDNVFNPQKNNNLIY